MTRARALKQVIRERATKTGERYTTARRHVLRGLNEPKGSFPPTSAKATVGKHVPGPKPVASTKGGLSDAKSLEKTGHDLAHWFDVLDRFDAVTKGHTRAADHLYSEHGVPGWYCQGITVAYERARGVRTMNQRCDGAFEVSVSKVMAANPAQLIKAISDKKQRLQWTAGVDDDLVKALTSAVSAKTSKGFVTRADGQARFRYKWNDTTVQFNMYPKGAAKTSFVVQHMNLEGADAVDSYRAKWRAAFNAIAALFA
jgi:hypothetical protein